MVRREIMKCCQCHIIPATRLKHLFLLIVFTLINLTRSRRHNGKDRNANTTMTRARESDDCRFHEPSYDYIYKLN